MNRLTAVIDELGNKTSYKYDALDNIAQVTDALKHITRYTYDKNGNLLTETDALGNRVRYAYTPEGWLESITKADGTVLTFEYDKTGSLLTQHVGDGQTVESSYNETGRVTEVSSAEGTIVYQYNGQGYLVSVTNVNGDKVSYTYDAYGNRTSMTYPDGRMVSYTYDAMNRMTSVTGLDGDVTRYTYDAAGRRIETASGTLTTSYRYDSVGNLLTQATSGASEIAFSYSYNKNGYITGEVRTEGGKTTESTYAYDALGQLTSFLQSTGYEEQYAYDKAGNMTEKVLTGTDGIETALKMSYNKGNQLTTMVNGKDKIAYTYDKNGSMVTKVLTSQAYGKLTDAYAYNALDQLTEYVGYDGYQQEFTYDANGMRLSKSEVGNGNRSTLEELLRGNIAGLPEIVEPTQGQINADEADMPAGLEWATTEYLYDLTQEYYQVISETTTSSGGASSTTAYAYGLERIAAFTSDSRTSYVYDGRGSVAQAITMPIAGEAVSSALPDVSVQVQSFSYTAFGEQMGSVKVSGFSYNAEAFDAATGMLNLRARQYEPALGRFSAKDFIKGNAFTPLSLNRYSYGINSPIIHTDPSGMWFSKLVNTAKNVIDKIATTVKKAVNTAVTYVKATAQKKIIDDANMFASYSNQFYERNAEEQSIIREAVRQIQQYDIYTQSGRAEAIRIMAEACSALKKIENANKEVVTPTPQPAATPAPPAADSPAPQPSRDDDWDIMFRGQEIADAILQHLIPEYNQTAKQYAGLTGNQDRFPILEEPGAAFEQLVGKIVKTVAIIGGTAVVVTLVVTTAGAAAYVVGQGAIYYGLSQTAAEALMYTVAYGSVGTYTVLQASDIVETWTDENTLLEKVFNNDRDAYETAKSLSLAASMAVPVIGSYAPALGYGQADKSAQASQIEELNPNTIRYSQNSVNGSQPIVDSMKANGWQGDPIDVVQMPDGNLTTIDNTRVVAAREAGINVQANVHSFNEPLPEEFIERFTTKNGVPQTWGEAILLRIQNQSGGFSTENPYGAQEMMKIN
ncbi:MAG: hypothetical protein DBY40_04425 [Clostridiales bacterium]|nr:MAG: hypothetical protein DBY40_04425 [Clostridiales bacterium]